MRKRGVVAAKLGSRGKWLVSALLLLGVALALLVAAVISRQPGQLAASEGMRTDLRVANISCSSCLLRMRWELGKLDGVISMAGRPGGNMVRVEHVATLSALVIATTLQDLGYQVTIVESRGAGGTELKTDERQGGRDPAPEVDSHAGGAIAEAWRKLFHRWFGDGGNNR